MEVERIQDKQEEKLLKQQAGKEEKKIVQMIKSKND